MKRILLVVAMLSLAGTASAVMDVPSGGWDQALNITANTTIDLSQAITGTWDTQPAGYVAGKGIYDPEKWAIVFHYTSVTVASGVTLKFTNHPANPPVVWLVEGTVVINGTVSLAGTTMYNTSNVEGTPGPGGFRGGRRGLHPALAGHGFGPGGGAAGFGTGQAGAGGGYASLGYNTGGGTTYGNAAIVPLIGGSGGGGGSRNTSDLTSGGGGGGAIMIGAQTSIVISGALICEGGWTSGGYNGGGGSGGAIRLISPAVSGTGTLQAKGGNNVTGAGLGRIRIEAATQDLAGLGITPPASVVDPGDTPQFWQDSATPSVKVISINGSPVPSDPRSQLNYPSQDLSLSGAGDVTVLLEATNLPTNGTIQVFIVKQGGPRTLLPTSSVTLIGGSTALSTWQAVFPAVTNGMYAIQARAVLP